MTWASIQPHETLCKNSLNSLAVPRYSGLREDIKNVDQVIQSLMVERKSIVSVDTSIGSEGFASFGLFRVKTSTGTAVMKIYPAGVTESYKGPAPPKMGLSDYKYGITIHNYLGKQDLAPKVQGVLSAQEVQKLIVTDPFLKNYGHPIWTPGFAVLMDEVPEAWCLNGVKAPAHILEWDVKRLDAQFKKIQKSLEKLRILLDDPQVLISREGHVYLVDMDDYRFVTHTGIVYGQPQVSRSLEERTKLREPMRYHYAHIFNLVIQDKRSLAQQSSQ